MAGTNRALKPNEVLFSLGDQADYMCLVRKGNLRVFLPKGSEEVTLATLNEGSIVGEMAFFDNKPRSASVKAADSCEVTLISKADFDKLLAQVPKWMVTMMQSLVQRLRTTNEKLQTLEATAGGASAPPTNGLILPNQKHPFQHAIRVMRIVMLSLAKDGTKDGSEMLLHVEHPKKLFAEFFDEDLGIVDKVLKIIVEARFVARRLDDQKQPLLVFTNRGALNHFITAASEMVRTLNPAQPLLIAEATELFEAMLNSVTSSGYEALNVSLKNTMAEAKGRGLEVTEWPKAIGTIALLVPGLKVSKAPGDITIRIAVKEHKVVVGYLKNLKAFYDAKLA